MSGESHPPVVLVHGSDSPRVRDRMREIRDAFPAEALETFDAGSASAADVVAACSMIGLLSAERCVVVTSVDGWKQADVDELIAYLEAPVGETLLLLTGDALRKNSRLVKAITKAGREERIDVPSAREMVAWVAAAFERRGAAVDRRAATALVERVGTSSTARLDSAVDLLVTYAGGETVTPGMVAECVPISSEMSVFAISDAWSSGDRAMLLATAHTLVVRDRESPDRLVALLAQHIRNVHSAQRMLADMPPDSVRERLKMHPFAARKCVEQAQRLSRARADAGLTRVALLEAEMRGVSALSSKDRLTVFERGLVELVL